MEILNYAFWSVMDDEVLVNAEVWFHDIFVHRYIL